MTSAAALGDDHTRQVAERLGGAVEASTRLALLQALSDAAAQVSADMAPMSVELRMSGADPELVVLVPAPAAEPTLLLPEEPAPRPEPEPDQAIEEEEEDEEEPVARISLRLPASLKAKVDQHADRDGLSTNAWLLRAAMDALGDRPTPPAPPTPPRPPGPENGPFGEYGVFGPHGPFGPGGLFGAFGRRAPEPHGPQPVRRGTVQGWVR